jgi:phytoene synthase
MKIDAAYAECRAIAKREAKNFYYAFLALPKEKSDAMCAVYAFMRRADDISDDESLSHGERRSILDAWLSEWHQVALGGESNNPVFIALRHTCKHFGITGDLLDQLVEGTAMDLSRPAATPDSPDTYAEFKDLYSYCYLVASVVGLVCIRIFGYEDPAAELLAEQTGIAFQLTNILRDVKEDAERGRIYLPLEDLAACNVSIKELQQLTGGTTMQARHRRLLKLTADRAEQYYASARKLLPLIDRESRPSLMVLVAIYHRLLKRIVAADYDVFTERASVPTHEKVGLLLLGMTKTFFVRLPFGGVSAKA